MFDVTPDEIAELNDTDLRVLVGRLCEAELASRGLSPAAVTWGGNQTAADGAGSMARHGSHLLKIFLDSATLLRWS